MLTKRTKRLPSSGSVPARTLLLHAAELHNGEGFPERRTLVVSAEPAPDMDPRPHGRDAPAELGSQRLLIPAISRCGALAPPPGHGIIVRVPRSVQLRRDAPALVFEPPSFGLVGLLALVQSVPALLQSPALARV